MKEKVFLDSWLDTLYIFEQRMWRRKDYKIIFNASDIGELYDIENDKEEMNNLFYNEEYKHIKKEMLEEII
ncbi:MAG: DUF4976 domain-containing protein [Fusobacterium varium]|uniref:sulfatase/phosphatase domain-containing protein n=1 Tax=Fusobacterium varium TaxID=856 RepID=UPI00242A3C5B|nr:sulfatase/phosphatase domain-containing protein [Fusobacterium varium]UYI79250.1 MAG: DUF4976 domain-containing protein [Fusobacterium varium]